jgi:hypothetical protein
VAPCGHAPGLTGQPWANRATEGPERNDPKQAASSGGRWRFNLESMLWETLFHIAARLLSG